MFYPSRSAGAAIHNWGKVNRSGLSSAASSPRRCAPGDVFSGGFSGLGVGHTQTWKNPKWFPARGAQHPRAG